MEHNHYSKAPITEAVIEFRIAPTEKALEALDLITTRVSPTFGEKKILKYAQGQILLGEEVAASATTVPVGYMYTASDGHYVLQARLDGFAISRLQPYEAWDSFRQEAKQLFDIYLEVLQPKTIVSVAVRYINRFDIEEANVDLKDYFLTYPEVRGLGESLSGFFMQVTLNAADINATATINQALAESARESVISVILDIDVSRQGELAPDGDLWEIVESLRDREYYLFEASITDKTRGLIT